MCPLIIHSKARTRHTLSKCFLLLTLSLFSPLFAASYQGSIGSYPIWIDIGISAQDGRIEGSYFYEKTGISIPLEGTQKGNSITLTEHDDQGKVTGQFICSINGNEMAGTWTRESGKKRLKVMAKECTSQALKDSQQEAQLNAYDLELLNSTYPVEEEDDNECITSVITYDFKNRYIRSLHLDASYSCGAYPSGQSVCKTYETQTKKDIDFWQEIDPKRIEALKVFLTKETQKKLIECRTEYADSEWINIFSNSSYSLVSEAELETDPEKALDKIFTVNDVVTMMNEFYITSEGVRLGRCGYFGFPHVIMAMDFCGYVDLSSKTLDQYLKFDSILKKISK